MPITAIRYDIRDGCEEEIAEIVGGFTRPTTSTIAAGPGASVAKIISTAVFIQGATMVRFIEYEGDLDAVARFMADQPGVRNFEQRIKPYLAAPRDTDTVDGFVATFNRASMRCLAQFPPR